MPEDLEVHPRNGGMPPDHEVKKRRILFILLAYAALLGAVTVVLPEGNRFLDFTGSLPLLVLAIAWCHFDAQQHGHTMGWLMRLSMVLVFILAFPIYIFQTRGLRGFKTLALAGLFAVAMMALLFTTGFLTLYLRAVI